MNNLAVIQSIQKELDEVEKRRELLSTPEGLAEADKEMTSLLNAFVMAGYTLPKVQSFRQLASFWRVGLCEEIALYGMPLLKKAAFEFIKEDQREYRACPTIADIKAMCMKMGKNPRAEMARYKQAERERRLEAQWDRERMEKARK